MKIEACLMLLFNLVQSRGPHHPHGQQPVDQDHHHYRPQKARSVLSDPQLLQDITHLEEDLEEDATQDGYTIEDLHKMSPDELEFHYFLAHDHDGNHKLDGLELLKAVYHTVHHDNEMEGAVVKEDMEDLVELTKIVDQTIETDDTDGDGYISYPEYKAARFHTPIPRTSSVLAPASETASKPEPVHAPEVNMV